MVFYPLTGYEMGFFLVVKNGAAIAPFIFYAFEPQV